MKRWALGILLCLILGAVTTVAVAWGFAAYGPIRSVAYDSDWNENLERWWRENVPDAFDAFPVKPVPRQPRLRISPTGEISVGDLTPRDSMSMMSAAGMEQIHIFGTSLSRQFPSDAMASIWRFGWPRLSLEATRWVRFSTPQFHLQSNAIVIEPAEWTQVQTEWRSLDQRILPLKPVFPGFLIDTPFYASIWFGVLFGFASAKRAIRRRRGRCPRCGYDLRGNLSAGCSECGWQREESAA